MPNTNVTARYEIQHRAGVEWFYYARANDLEVARRTRTLLRRTGYQGRILDLTTGLVVE